MRTTRRAAAQEPPRRHRLASSRSGSRDEDSMPRLTLSEVAQLLNCPSPSEPARTVTGVATLTDAAGDDVSFLGSEKYLPDFEKTKAAAVIVQKRVKLPAGSRIPVLLVDNADLAVAQLLERFAPPIPRPPVGRHHTAIVAPSASVPPDARVGPN